MHQVFCYCEGNAHHIVRTTIFIIDTKKMNKKIIKHWYRNFQPFLGGNVCCKCVLIYLLLLPILMSKILSNCKKLVQELYSEIILSYRFYFNKIRMYACLTKGNLLCELKVKNVSAFCTNPCGLVLRRPSLRNVTIAECQTQK